MSDPAPGLTTRLRAAGCVFAEEEAALLVAAARDEQHLEELLTARVGGLPLELVVGWAELAGVRVAVAPGVFVPRRRSGLLVELAAAALATHPTGVLVDLCCGTGALALAVLARRSGIEAYAADLDPDAVDCARANLRDLPPGRVLAGDLYDALPATLRGRVDVLVVNAPYVPTAEIAHLPPEARDHEHRIALDGGGDGLDVHRRVAADAAAWLAPGGVLLIEVAAHQVPAALELLTGAGLETTHVEDAERGATVVRGVRTAGRGASPSPSPSLA